MKERIQFYFPFLILFFSIISILLIRFTYTSLVISGLCVIFSIIFSRKKARILLITLFISISTIITCCTIIYKEKEELIDKYKGTNIVLGKWIYNENGGSYVFNDDYTYIEYTDENSNDNYCTGKYNYTYGGIGNDGVIIREDTDFYYYNLNLNEEYCLLKGKEYYSEYKKKLVFSLNKKGNNNLLINKQTKEVFILTKK